MYDITQSISRRLRGRSLAGQMRLMVKMLVCQAVVHAAGGRLVVLFVHTGSFPTRFREL